MRAFWFLLCYSLFALILTNASTSINPGCLNLTSPINFTIANTKEIIGGNSIGFYGSAQWVFTTDTINSVFKNNVINYTVCTTNVTTPRPNLLTLLNQLELAIADAIPKQTLLYSTSSYILPGDLILYDNQCVYGTWNISNSVVVPILNTSYIPQLWFHNSYTRLIVSRMYTKAPELLYVSNLTRPLALGAILVPDPVQQLTIIVDYNCTLILNTTTLCNDFLDNMATILGIDRARLICTSVECGSVIIHFNVTSSCPNNDCLPASTQPLLSTQITDLILAEVSSDQSQVIEFLPGPVVTVCVFPYCPGDVNETTTIPPTTQAPTTQPPVTTIPPTTQPPTTLPPTTNPPTNATTTVPPTTQAPTTQGPTLPPVVYPINITVANFAFNVLPGGGTTVTINKTQTIQWIWISGTHHVVSGTSPTADGLFASASANTPYLFVYQFNNTGTFPFFCSIHPSMQGVITVVDPNATTSPPTNASTTAPPTTSAPTNATQAPTNASTTQPPTTSAPTNATTTAPPTTPAPTAPPDVTNLTNSMSNPSKVTWNVIPGAVKYFVSYQDYDASETFLGETDVYSIYTNYTISPIDPSHSYWFGIEGVSIDNVFSNNFNRIWIPPSPTNISLVFDYPSKTFNLTWSVYQSFTTTDHYIVTVYYNNLTHAIYNLSSSGYLLSGIPCITNVTVTIQATHSNSSGPWSLLSPIPGFYGGYACPTNPPDVVSQGNTRSNPHNITWIPVPSADHYTVAYNVYDTTGVQLSNSGVITIVGTQFWYDVSLFNASYSYLVAISAVSVDDLNSPDTSYVVIPSTPSNISLVFQQSHPNSNNLSITWSQTYSASTIDNYIIIINGVDRTTVPGTQLYYILNNITCNTVYHITLQATLSPSLGTWSNISQIATYTGFSCPTVPPDVVGANNSPSNASLVTWNTVTSAILYDVLVAEYNETGGKLGPSILYTINSPTTSLFISNQNLNHSYVIDINSYSNDGYVSTISNHLVIPPAPSNISTSLRIGHPKDNDLILTWNQFYTATVIDHYILTLVYNGGGGSPVTVTSSSTSYTILNLTCATTVTITIQGTLSSSTGPWSLNSTSLSYGGFSCPTQPPDVVGAHNTQANPDTISWSSVSGADHYIIDLFQYNRSTALFISHTTSTTSSLFYAIPSINPIISYAVFIEADSIDELLSVSEDVVDVPSAPYNISLVLLTFINSHNLSITWNQGYSTSLIHHYLVTVLTQGQGPAVQYTTNDNITSYLALSIPCASSVTVTIQAVTNDIPTSYSLVSTPDAVFTGFACPTSPPDVLNADNTFIDPSTITWNNVGSADHYSLVGVEYNQTGGIYASGTVTSFTNSYTIPLFNITHSYHYDIYAVSLEGLLSMDADMISIPSTPYGIVLTPMIAPPDLHNNLTITWLNYFSPEAIDHWIIRATYNGGPSPIVYTTFNSGTYTIFDFPCATSVDVQIRATLSTSSGPFSNLSSPSVHYSGYACPTLPPDVMGAMNNPQAPANVTWPLDIGADHYQVNYTEYNEVGVQYGVNITAYTSNLWYNISNFHQYHSYLVYISAVSIDNLVSPDPDMIAIPPSPFNVTLVLVSAHPETKNNLTVQWNALYTPVPIDHYSISITYNNMGPPTIVNVTSPLTSYSIQTLTCNVDVKVMIQASLSAYNGPYSASSIEQDYPGFVCPTQPADVINADNSATQPYNITWVAMPSAVSYIVDTIEYNTTGGVYNLVSGATTVLNYYVIPSYNQNHSYTVSIHGKSIDDLLSPDSDMITIPCAPNQIVLTPQLAHPETNNNLTITWNQDFVPDTIHHYDLLVIVNDVLPGTIHTAMMTTSHTLFTILCNTDYKITIQSTLSNAGGPWSSVSTPVAHYTGFACPTAPPDLTGANNSPLAASNITWSPGVGADHYEYTYMEFNEVGTSILTSSIIDTFNTYAIIPNYNASHSYHFTISSISIDQIDDTGDDHVYIPSTPNNVILTPQLAHPETNNNITITWTSLYSPAVVDHYIITILLNGSPTIVTSTTTSYIYHTLSCATTVSVTVQATLSSSTGPWSNISYPVAFYAGFTCPTVPPTVTGGDNTQLAPYTVTWNSVASADHYAITITQYNSTGTVTSTITTDTSSTTSYTVVSPNANHTYDVSIKAVSIDNLVSNILDTVTIPGIPQSVTVTPYLQHPNNRHLNISWTQPYTPVSIDHYFIYTIYQDDPNFGNDLDVAGLDYPVTFDSTTNTYSVSKPINPCGQSLTVVIFSTLTPGFYLASPGPYSNYSLSVRYPGFTCPTSPPTLTDATNSPTQPNNVSWTPISSAARYEYVYSEWSNTGSVIHTADTNFGTGVVTITGQSFLIIPSYDSTHAYQFRIDAVSIDEQYSPVDDIVSLPSLPRTVTLTPVLAHPETNNNLTISWLTGYNPISIHHYILVITSNDGGGDVVTTYTTSSTSYSLGPLVCATDYKVTVQATNSASLGPWSNVTTSVDYPGFACPVALADVTNLNNTQASPYNVSWTGVTGIQYYNIYTDIYGVDGGLISETISTSNAQTWFVVPPFIYTNYTYVIAVTTVSLDNIESAGKDVIILYTPQNVTITPSTVVGTTVNLTISLNPRGSPWTPDHYVVTIVINDNVGSPTIINVDPIIPGSGGQYASIIYTLTGVVCGYDVKVTIQSLTYTGSNDGGWSGVSTQAHYTGFACPAFTVTPLRRFRGDAMALSFTTPTGGVVAGFAVTISDPLSGFTFTTPTGQVSPAYFIALNQSITYSYTVQSTAIAARTAPYSSVSGTVSMYQWTPNFYITFNKSAASENIIDDTSGNARVQTVVGAGGTVTTVSVTGSFVSHVRAFSKATAGANYFFVNASISASFYSFCFWTFPTDLSPATSILIDTAGLTIQYSTAFIQIIQGSDTLTSTTTNVVSVWIHHCIVYDGTLIMYYRNGTLDKTITRGTTWSGTTIFNAINIGKTMIGQLDDLIAFNYVTTPSHIMAIYSSLNGGTSATVTQTEVVNIPSITYSIPFSVTVPSNVIQFPFTYFNRFLGIIRQVQLIVQVNYVSNYSIICTTGTCAGNSVMRLTEKENTPGNVVAQTSTITLPTDTYSAMSTGQIAYFNDTLASSNTQTITTNLPLMYSWGVIPRSPANLYTDTTFYFNGTVIFLSNTLTQTTGTAALNPSGSPLVVFTGKYTSFTWSVTYFIDSQVPT